MKDDLTKEQYKQGMINYKEGFFEMSSLCMRMLKGMKKQMWISCLFYLMYFILGILWGISITGWLR